MWQRIPVPPCGPMTMSGNKGGIAMLTDKPNEQDAGDEGSADAVMLKFAQLMDQKIQAALADALAPIVERITNLENQVDTLIMH
jgi:hypothetical protein